MIQEDRRRWLLVRSALRQDGPAVGEVGLERVSGGTSEKSDPLLAALAHDPDLAAPEIDGAEVGRSQLADAEARRIRCLDDRSVTQRQCEPECAPVRVLTWRRVEVLVDRREKPVHLLDFEDSGKAPRLARRADRAPRVAGRETGSCR